MILFQSLFDMSLYTKEFPFFFLFLTGLVNPGGTDAISEQKGQAPLAQNLFFTDRLSPSAYHFADSEISNGSFCFASAAMAPVKEKQVTMLMNHQQYFKVSLKLS